MWVITVELFYAYSIENSVGDSIMRIVSRKVTTPHSKAEVFQIMKNSAAKYRKTEFGGNCFRIAVPTRWHRQMGFIPVRGTVNIQNGLTEVRLEIHGSFLTYIGILAFFAGILLLICEFLTVSAGVDAAFLCLAVGVCIYVLELMDGIVCLDSLEHRLTREVDLPVDS